MTRHERPARSILMIAGALLGFAFSSWAQPITVLPLRDVVSVRPPAIVTLALSVENPGPESRELEFVPIVPDGLRTLALVERLQLAPETSDTLLVPIQIPSTMEAGSYEILVQVRSLETGDVEATAEFTVVILPTPDLELWALRGRSEAVPAGAAEYRVEVRNTGNTRAKFRLELESRWPADSAPMSGSLAPGARQVVTVTHEVPQSAVPGSEDWLTVRVHLNDDPQPAGRLTLVTRTLPSPASEVSRILMEVLPAETTFDITGGPFSVPLSAALSFSSAARFGESELDVDLGFDSIFGPDPVSLQRALVRYSRLGTEFRLGDVSPDVSVLLPFSCRGATWLASGTWHSITFGGGVEGDAAYAGGALLVGPAALRAGATYVERRSPTEQDTAWIAAAQASPAAGLGLRLEGGFGSSDLGRSLGGLARIALDSDLADLEGTAVWSGPYFFGPYRDSLRWSLTSRAAFPGLTLLADCAYSRSNVLDRVGFETLRKNALNAVVHLGGRRPWPTISLVTDFGWERGTRDGLSCDERSQSYALSMSGEWSPATYRIAASLEQTIDPGFDRRDVAIAALASVSYALDEFIGSVALDFRQLQDLEAGVPISRSLDVLFSLAASDGPGAVDLAWTRSEGLHELSLQTGLPIGDGASIRAMGIWIWSEDDSIPPGIRWSVSVRTAFNVPIPFLVTRGQIEGRAFVDLNGDGRHQDEEPGIGGVLLSDGTDEALSEDSGAFRFPPASSGERTLSLLNFPADVIPAFDQPPPVRVVVEEVVHVDLPFVHAATLRGRVQSTYEEEPSSASIAGTGTEDTGPLSGVALWLSGPGGTFTTRSGLSGEFEFGRLIPGDWALSVDATSLPPFHRPARQEVLLSLRPGDVTEIDLIVLIARRPIDMLDSRPLELTENGADP
ncbi:hypothetical protein ACFLTM_05045 [Candidatus Bipolaricaulota bacterium]